MFRYERLVHVISIVWRGRAAKRRALKSLSGNCATSIRIRWHARRPAGPARSSPMN